MGGLSAIAQANDVSYHRERLRGLTWLQDVLSQEGQEEYRRIDSSFARSTILRILPVSALKTRASFWTATG